MAYQWPQLMAAGVAANQLNLAGGVAGQPGQLAWLMAFSLQQSSMAMQCQPVSQLNGLAESLA